MKVIEAISDTNIGGAGILLLTRLKYTDRKRFETTVLLPTGSKLKERLEALEVPTIELQGCQDRSLDWRAVSECKHHLQVLRPDLINCHGILTCRLAAWQCHVPIRVYTRHCAYRPSRWQQLFPVRLILGGGQAQISNQIIAVADAAKKDLLEMGVPSERIRVIINGVEGLLRQTREECIATRERLRIPNDAIVIGICARLEHCKGHGDFLRAAQLLRANSERYYFLIVGAGSLERELKAFCESQGLTSCVRFTGFAEDVTSYYNIMDINVNCSVGTETSSLALSEGMSLGIPAVVSDYGGNPYMICHGENGLVYPMGRYDVLAEAIRRLSEDRSLYQSMSEKALRRFRSELNAVHMTEQTNALYDELYELHVMSKCSK